MKAITIIVHEEKQTVGDTLVPVTFAHVELGATWPADNMELAGILLGLYLNYAEKFIETPPAGCVDCGAYKVHNAAMHRIRVLMKEVTGVDKPQNGAP